MNLMHYLEQRTVSHRRLPPLVNRTGTYRTRLIAHRAEVVLYSRSLGESLGTVRYYYNFPDHVINICTGTGTFACSLRSSLFDITA